LPDVLIFRIYVKPSLQKYFAFTEAQITCMSALSRALQEGRIAIVTTRGCGMRWMRRHCWTSDADRDGEIAWSWRPDAGVKPARDEREATEAIKPGTPGRARISRKTIAQGMPVFRRTCGD
jgi:hypothetical protein